LHRSRAQRLIVFALLLVLSWIVMAFLHELGHLIGGWLGGGTLVDCELAPWRLPYSLHSPDPNPRLTLWAGPLVGVIVPVVAALIIRRRWATFIADFCLIANGCYLALAWLSGDRLLDTPRMLAAGIHPLAIAVYCAITIGIGYPRFRNDCQDRLATAPPAPLVERQNA
jgi:hypothetical protein